MQGPMETTLIVIGATVAIYLIVAGMANRVARPWRMEMAALGRDLLERADIPEKVKKYISHIMDRAFDWSFMIRVVAEFPGDAYRLLSQLGRSEKQGIELPRELASFVELPEGRRFLMLAQRSMLAANPLFTLLWFVEIIPFILIVVAMGSTVILLRGVQPLIERSFDSNNGRHAH